MNAVWRLSLTSEKVLEALRETETENVGEGFLGKASLEKLIKTGKVVVWGPWQRGTTLKKVSDDGATPIVFVTYEEYLKRLVDGFQRVLRGCCGKRMEYLVYQYDARKLDLETSAQAVEGSGELASKQAKQRVVILEGKFNIDSGSVPDRGVLKSPFIRAIGLEAHFRGELEKLMRYVEQDQEFLAADKEEEITVEVLTRRSSEGKVALTVQQSGGAIRYATQDEQATYIWFKWQYYPAAELSSLNTQLKRESVRLGSFFAAAINVMVGIEDEYEERKKQVKEASEEKVPLAPRKQSLSEILASWLASSPLSDVQVTSPKRSMEPFKSPLQFFFTGPRTEGKTSIVWGLEIMKNGWCMPTIQVRGPFNQSTIQASVTGSKVHLPPRLGDLFCVCNDVTGDSVGIITDEPHTIVISVCAARSLCDEFLNPLADVKNIVKRFPRGPQTDLIFVTKWDLALLEKHATTSSGLFDDVKSVWTNPVAIGQINECCARLEQTLSIKVLPFQTPLLGQPHWDVSEYRSHVMSVFLNMLRLAEERFESANLKCWNVV